MPTEQPSNVPAGSAPEPRDEASVGAVLSDPRDGASPGGGGLGGAAAADPLSGSARGTSGGGATPNSPIDTGVSGGDASAEARVRATDD